MKLNVDYSYLHLTTSDISNTHIIDAKYQNIPVFNAIKDNFYYKEGLYFNNYNEEDFVKALKDEILTNSDSKKIIINIKFTNKADENSANTYIDNNLFNLIGSINAKFNSYTISTSSVYTIKLTLKINEV